MPLRKNVQNPLKESQLQLAIQAIQRDATLSQRRAAAIYSVSQSTLSDRLAGKLSREDSTPNSMKLLVTEEQTIVNYILDLDARGYPLHLPAIKDLADSLLAARHRDPVGPNWPRAFIKRRPELKMKFNRKYDYRRALCEDPELVQGWFRLVQNTKAKYGIQDNDMYNFDETGFMMGMHNSSAVVTASERRLKPKSLQQGNKEWVTSVVCVSAAGWAIPPFIIFQGKHHLSAWYKEDSLPKDWVIGVSENGWTTNELGLKWLEHFDRHTKERTVGAHRLLILDGHESHNSVEFQQYCTEAKIITLCMPPHSSHLLQPLDVGCFSPLKRAYGRQAEDMMRNRINHITKIEFLPAFQLAYRKTITKDNILGGFRGAGLVPHDPEVVISKLDVKLRTPSPPAVEDLPWLSQTPSNTLELGSQSTLVKQRIQRHIDSSPSSMVVAFEKLAKGAAIIAQKLVLSQKRVSELEAANQAATQRRSHKRKRVQKGEALTIEEGERLATLREFGARSDGKKVKKRARVEAGKPSQRHCRRCGETGHNLRTCKQDIEDNSE
jgi:hypothetical protein